MNAVIYARYSSSKQREESIEAQLKVCHKYAEEKGYIVVGEYADRAISGRSDDRPQFQKMIHDSKKRHFEKVIVYRLDRFSRDSFAPILYMAELEKSNVKVESATENIPGGAMETVLLHLILGMNASYSVELGEKVTRNMELNAEKCLSNGGTTPLGYRLEKVDPLDERSKKKYVLDEKTAPIVQEIFTKYADGWSIVRICEDLNARHILSAQKKPFNKNSLHTMLKNRKYLGIYIYKDKEIPGGMPQIISQELFDKVQEKMIVNKKAPARSRARAEYILSGKLFCGYCKEKMVGHGSNQMNRRGVYYNYYKCKNAGAGGFCKKKLAPKSEIEDIVVTECRKLLSDENIRRIAQEVVKISKSMDDRTELDRLHKLMKKAEEEKSNQMVSLRACTEGTIRNMIFEDLGNIAKKIEELEKAIAKEEARHYVLEESQVIEHLQGLADGSVNDLEYRKTLIKVFVNAVYLYDDKFTITFNTGDEEVTISNVLLDKIAKDMDSKSLCLLNNSVHQRKPA